MKDPLYSYTHLPDGEHLLLNNLQSKPLVTADSTATAILLCHDDVLMYLKCARLWPSKLRLDMIVDALQVFLGRWQGTPVAVKVLKATARADAATIADFQKEAEMLCSLRHPHILNFFGACATADLVRWPEAESLSWRDKDCHNVCCFC